MNNHQYCVYILSNYSHTTFYIGVTNDIYRRLYEHKHKINDGFTAKYDTGKLLYCEFTDNIENALNREKQLKNWHSQWKINLIKSVNPEFKDISADIGYKDY